MTTKHIASGISKWYILAKGTVVTHHMGNIYLIHGQYYVLSVMDEHGLIPYDSLTEKEKFMFELAGIIPGRLL